jgi:hypothetical protein
MKIELELDEIAKAIVVYLTLDRFANMKIESWNVDFRSEGGTLKAVAQATAKEDIGK